MDMPVVEMFLNFKNLFVRFARLFIGESVVSDSSNDSSDDDGGDD